VIVPPAPEPLSALAEARAAILLGSPAEALEPARRVRDSARASGDRRLEAQALLVESAALSDDRKQAEAEKAVEDASLAAEASGQALLAASAWAERAFLAGLDPARAEEAERFDRHASAFLEAAGGDASLEARLLTLRGERALDRGDFAAASEAFAAEASLRERAFDSQDPALAETLADLARAKLGADDGGDALSDLERAIELGGQSLGAAHPSVAGWRLLSCRALLGLGRAEEAKEACARGIQTLGDAAVELLPIPRGPAAKASRAAFEADFALMVASQLGARQKSPEAALAALSLASRWAEQAGDDSRIAAVLSTRGHVLLRAGRPAEAIPELERAIPLLGDGGERARATAELSLSKSLLEAGRDPERARALERKARLMLGQPGGEEPLAGQQDLAP
jgi:hypothetical protein